MAIHPAYAQVLALLIAVLILITGNGLLQTLLPLSAADSGFSGFSVGLIGSAYYAGMLIGCIACPRIVARVGHIRAFAAFASVTAVTTLLHPLYVDPAAWMAIRFVCGISFAGLFATGESWLHDKAENVVRGRVMAIYSIVNQIGLAIGQQAIRFASTTSFSLFTLAASAISLSVLPLAFTRTEPPEPPPVPRLRMLWLFRISPVAVVGALAAGTANGTLWSLAPVFARESGLDDGEVATFMTAIILGAAFVQWQVGRWADLSDRRHVLLGAMAMAIAVELALAFIPNKGALILSVLAIPLGAATLVVYPLSSSHAADLAGRENLVEVSSALLLTYTIGAIFGPTLAAILMDVFAPGALFAHNAAIHAALVGFVLWRLRRRPPGPKPDAAG
jgi:MFS family permease